MKQSYLWSCGSQGSEVRADTHICAPCLCVNANMFERNVCSPEATDHYACDMSEMAHNLKLNIVVKL